MQDSNPANWKRDETPKSFYNPLEKDILVDWRDDDNVVRTRLLPALDVSTAPAYLADNFIIQIENNVINARSLGIITPEVRAELRKEIEVNHG